MQNWRSIFRVMALRPLLRPGLLGICYVMLCSSPVLAQLPRRCASNPTVSPKVVVDSVKFDDTQLPSPIQDQIVAKVKQGEFRATSGWVNDLEEADVRDTLGDQGYFRAQENAKADVISTDTDGEHVAITLHIQKGLQYRVGEIHFHAAQGVALTFPTEELRKLVPVKEGDLFSATKIRAGLDALKRLYATVGYINFVAEPRTWVDDASQLVSLDIELDQQKQFRIGKIEILGLDPTLESVLRQKIEPGAIFNYQPVQEFYDEYKSALPLDASVADDKFVRDTTNGIVDVEFDFRVCSAP